MIFGKIIFLLTGITATAAVVQEATPADRVVLAQYDVVDKLYLEPHSDAKRRSEGNITGTITIYGPKNPQPSLAAEVGNGRLAKRCGSNRVECHGTNAANFFPCQELINILRTQTIDVPRDIQDICHTDSQILRRCCVSWAHPVRVNVDRSALWPAASSVLNRCTFETEAVSPGKWVSGLTRDTLIGNTCTTQCLSISPSSCR
ncbi:hypothetical protein B0J11DRAFT_578901 [Dendryphion nanum]|uniref:WD-like domain-containing protein n=1 Tax=Dendryphion nanum TaxID=256645 RepID=A0A9P9E0N8_9PLEO|nr:hypothetical protein B0J11DRAFT_578901 [Dendryphion nanum]